MKHSVNISIDDISPHPMSSIKVIDQCEAIIKEFEDAKFSLFVPISYWRTVKKEVATKNPLQINMFPEFCERLKNLPKENFEICYHGFYHGIPGKSDNDEFQYFNEEDAIKRIEAMFEVVKLAGLEDSFRPIFRPPAWRMSPGSIRAARNCGIKVLALSSKEYAKKTYQKEEEKKNDVVYYNVNPPFDELALYEKTEIVYHACEWDRNFLSKKMSKDLIEFLISNREVIEFKFLEEMMRTPENKGKENV